MRSPRILAAGCLVVALAAWGCGPSRPARLEAPELDVEAVVAGIMQADADGDGKLASGELAKAPAFRDALAALDVDGDKALSRAELESWLAGIKASRIAVTSAVVVVRHKGRAVAGATVKFVPEAFMSGAATAAEGTTDAAGQAQMTIPGSRYPGVNCGVYRVEITGPGSDGKPIPAKYNSSSTLGAAVGGGLPAEGVFAFSLD